MKRTFIALLALVLLITAIPFAAFAEEEQYTYTMAMYNFGPIDDDAVMVKYWNEKYGVKFQPLNIEQSSIAETINLMVANGETPDILQQIDANAYYEQGIIGGWSEEFFRENAPLTAAYLDENAPQSWAYAKYDGVNMYSIPGLNLELSYPKVFIWRTDWLEALGYDEIPETLEDVEEAFYKIAKEDPDGNGIDDTYALSNTALAAIYGAFGFQREIWLENGDGTVTYGDVMPGAKDALELLNKWYEDGVLDPEFASGENQGGYWAITHSFLNGRIGTSAMGNFYHWVDCTGYENCTWIGRMAEAIRDSGQDIKFAPGHAPIGENDVCGMPQPDMVSLRTHFSKTLVDDTERFARLLQIIDDMMMKLENCAMAALGIPGETYEIIEWEGAQVVNMLAENNTSAINPMGAGGWFMFSEEYTLEFQNIVYGYEFKWVEDNMADYTDGYANAIFGALPSDSKYSTECTKILNEGYIAIITGEKPIEYFDEMVAAWYAAGGDVLTEEANAKYAEIKG